MTARSLLVGFDGADLDVVRALGRERLPMLHALIDRGAHAHLETVRPPATLPAWTTFLTGLGPGRHGVFDFTTRRGYRVRFTAGTVREAPTFVARLDALGLRCACVGFPATWPPEPLRRGIFISGWDAPVAFEADRSFVWPPALFDEIHRRFGGVSFDDVDELGADTPGWHSGLADALVARVARKTDLARWLLERERWDVFAFYFGESDTASHYLWSLGDPSSPRRPPFVSARDADGLGRVYEALDRALDELIAVAGTDVEITVLSDHGSGGSSDKVLYLNRVLAAAGLLRFHDGTMATRATARAKELALTKLPPRLRERIFRVGGAALPSWLESRARFGAIDMTRTTAFSEELNYFPGVSLNVRGREPSGTVAASDLRRVRACVRDALLAIRDPWTGARVVREVLDREAIYEGPFVDRAPDLILELELDRGYSYNLMPSGGPGVSWRRLGPNEVLGRKGRSLPGSHRPRGLFVAAGPRVAPAGEIDAGIADVAATALARLDVGVPADFAGRVLWEALAESSGTVPRALPDVGTPERRVGDEASVEARLRALGYID